jgi:membrane protease YdiL (CAAX protease family)
MAENILQIGQGQGSTETPVETVSRHAVTPFGSGLSRLVSVVSAMILLGALGSILWFSATVPKLERLEEPDRALDLMVSRIMEAQDGLQRSPAWQQRLAEWIVGSSEKERLMAIQWYQELADTTGDPSAKLRLAILQAETGQSQNALAQAAQWWDLDAPMPLYSQWITAAYGTQALDRERAIELHAALADTLDAGWFYNRLASRLAQRTGDQALSATIERQIEAQGLRLHTRSNRLLFEVVCLILGSAVFVGLMWLRTRRPDAVRLHQPGVPPPWPGVTGTAVLLRGGALGAVITTAFLTFPPIEHASLRALAIPLANLPLLALAYIHLLKPAGLDFQSGFGLRLERAQLGRLIGAILAVVAAGLWGEWVMGRAADAFNLTNHWTEWFDPNLVWASGSALTVSLLEYVIFAPIFEEIAFRGLLYAILRRRLSFVPAALLSASIFALAHGYGIIGFVSVLWSGFLWAWIYEKTGSLIPGMIAHAMNNLLVSLAVMVLLRG